MNTYEDIKLEKEVEIATLNEVLSKLLMNDKEMVPVNTIRPSIWVARWINGEDAYNRDDAVWVNTESVDDFVKNRTEYIKIYLRQDKRYYGRINQAEANNDTQEMYKILKEGVQANDIFYLGDLTLPVQIKICKKDGTKQPPSNSEYWDDFWVTSNDEECRNYIMQEMFSYLTRRFNNHIRNYHLSGWTQSDFDTYLDKNLTNIPYDSKYHYFSHRSKQLRDGFDFVKRFESKDFGGGVVKWFRLWNSGFLEQGGVIDTSSIDTSQDSIQQNIVTVNLNWSGAKFAPPAYDYIRTDYQTTYGSDSWFKAYGDAVGINESNVLDRKNTYQVKVTPISDGGNVYSTYNSEESFYDICPVLEIGNTKFRFIKDNSASRYSFYTSGFTTHIS